MNMIYRLMLLMTIFMLLTASGLFAQNNAIENLLYMTEQYPPHNYEENGILKGASIEILEMIWQKMGVNLTRNNIELVPWARGYKDAQNNPRGVLFGMGKSEEREEYFKFVGPYYTHRVVVISKKSSNINISAPDELKRYRIGTFREDIGEQKLVQKYGYNLKELDRSVISSSLARKLDSGRIQLVATSEDAFFEIIKKMNLNPDNFEVEFVLSEGISSYAFNKEVPDEIINRFQEALNELIKSGEVKKVLEKYDLK